MASQFANGKRRKRDRDGRRRTARSLPSIIFYRASTYRQPRTHDRVHAHARATRIINHYYLGVIFLRYNFVCLPPRVGARGLCTPRTRGQGSVSKSGAVLLSPPPRLLLHRLHVVSSICLLPSFFLLVSFSSSSVYFFTVRELSTSTFMCTHACSFVSLKLDVFPTPMTVKSGLFFLPRERSSFRGSRSNGLHQERFDQIARIFLHFEIILYIQCSWRCSFFVLFYYILINLWLEGILIVYG